MKKGKLFLIVGFQLINMEGMLELENIFNKCFRLTSVDAKISRQNDDEKQHVCDLKTPLL